MSGTIMAIGGAMDLHGPVVEAFYKMVGGADGNIVILPTASALTESGQEVADAFQELGLRQPARVLPVRQRMDAYDEGIVADLYQATGIFMMGGNQLRLTALVGGTPLHEAMLQTYESGTIVAGTSAGAASLSQLMIAYGRSGSAPRMGMVQLVPGLGFTSRLIIDQHFHQRNRLGRLLLAVAINPVLVGVGIDENTAAVLNTNTLAVIGKRAVTIVDGSQIAASDVSETGHGSLVAISGARLHILKAGWKFDISSRKAILPEEN
jgi:cyanophycinase